MKIVIAGAGEVGGHLAKMLYREKEDIVLMDQDIERLNIAGAGLELLPFLGNPTSLNDLKLAGANEADLFVSVTPEESTNVTACILAASLGAQRTFARINNYEYLQPENYALFRSMGVHSMIYPEMLAAKEIVSAIDRPWTRQYWDLFGGKLTLIGVKVRNGAPIVNCQLSDLMKRESKLFHIVAIKRGGSTIIPNGSHVIHADDILFFVCHPEQINHVREQAGKEDPDIKKIIIMGGSRIAMRAAEYLPSNIRIKIIEKDREKSRKIADIAPNNVMIIYGDGRDTDLLIQEGILDSQAFIALTENSGTNILSSLAAKRLGVFKTIANVENIDYIPLAEKFDIGTVINKKLIAAGNIYQFLLDADVSNVKCLTFAHADVAELVARPGSKITKAPVKELNLPKDMTIGGLLRNGVPMLVEGDTQILPSDQVVVFCLESMIRKLENIFN